MSIVTKIMGMDNSPRRLISKSTTASYLNRNCWMFSFVLCILVLKSVGANDPVYIRSGAFMSSYGQLITSSALRWVKGQNKDSLKLIQDGHDAAEARTVCRVWHTGLRGVGLIAANLDVCNISTQEGLEGTEKYQTISANAARLTWTTWSRPNQPPPGSVSISVKPQKFVAADHNKTMIGYLDPTMSLGSAIFPDTPEPTASCLVLTEIEPSRYELSDVQLKRNKGFIEEDIVLAYGKLKYEASEPDWVLEPNESNENDDDKTSSAKKGMVESILSYETNHYEYWGQGYLMAKGLHTSINLPDGSSKVIEWGIPLTQAGKTETMTVKEELFPGTGLNVTLKGTRLNGEMSYWASLKTHFKDDTSLVRLIDGHRKVIEIRNIRLEVSKPYYLNNGELVPEPTTTTPTTTTTTELVYSQPFSSVEENNSSSGNSNEAIALPIENDIQSDQSQNLMADMKSSSPAAKSIAFSHSNSNWKFDFPIIHFHIVFAVIYTLFY